MSKRGGKKGGDGRFLNVPGQSLPTSSSVFLRPLKKSSSPSSLQLGGQIALFSLSRPRRRRRPICLPAAAAALFIKLTVGSRKTFQSL